MSQSDHDGISRWEAALAAYEATRRAHADFKASQRARYLATMREASPRIVEPGLHYGLARRWASVEALDRDVLLTDTERRELRPLLEEHGDRLQTYYSRPTATEEDEQSEELYDAFCEAESVLLLTAAPTVGALALKMGQAYRQLDDDRFGFDDLGRAAADLDRYLADRCRVVGYGDLLRLAGIDHPILHMDRFSPREWVAAYREAGGVVSMQQSALLLIPADAGEAAPGGPLQSELDLTPWKYRAVQIATEQRLDEGGDPLFTSRGEPRPPAWPLAPKRPFAHVERIIFETQDGAPSPIVQSWVREGDRLVLEPRRAAA